MSKVIAVSVAAVFIMAGSLYAAEDILATKKAASPKSVILVGEPRHFFYKRKW